jgi:hypothetical protein
MARLLGSLACGLVACAANFAVAQPTITSLGSGGPNSVTNNIGGSYLVGGSGMTTTAADRWTLTGSTLTPAEVGGSGGGLISADGAYQVVLVPNNVSQVMGNTATGVSPPFSTTPTLVPSATAPATTEFCLARLQVSSGTMTRLGGLPITPSLMVYGSGSSGSGTGTFVSGNAISANGRFIVGMGYISAYSSSAGTTITASNFQWRPWIWDAQANGGNGAFTVLSTPFRTSTNTWRRRTGNAFAVSADGQVVVGAQEHNVSTTASADPDGARLVVWRYNAGTSNYDMTFLPNGQDASGNYYTLSQTPGTVLMNQAGTIIVGRAVDNTGTGFVGKWVWNTGTNAWDAPINLGSNLATPASWLPLAVTSCGIPPTLTPTGMSDDGNTVVGTVAYSTCGSFMSGGFIRTTDDGGAIHDWYDYMVSLNTAPSLFSYYGPIGDNGDQTRGLPKLGYPTSISADGSTIVGLQGGSQIIPFAGPWIVNMSGGPTCVAPVITRNPANTMFTRCSFGTTLGTIIENASAAGTLPISYQWTRNGNTLSDGATGTGSTITGSATPQIRVMVPGPADAGNYACTVTGCNNQTATTTAATVQTDPAAATPPNDTCASATPVGEGTFNFNICGAYNTDGFSTCLISGSEIGDVWYSYTPTFTGVARFQTCASTFDTTLQVMDSCGGAVLACNDDVGARGLIGTTCSSARSLISRFAVTAGQTVIVRVGAKSAPFTNSATSGALTISQVTTPIPANDLCSNATPVGIGTFNFDLTEATDDYNFGADTCGATGNTFSTRDVWFRLVAPCGATFSVDTCGSTITNPMLHVMSDCSGTILACNDNVGTVTGCTANQARITNLTVGGSVLIRVSSSGTGAPNSGLGHINITGTITQCCGSADFNCDGDVGTDADIEAFFSCLSGICPAPPCTSNADFNGDGDVGTDADIEAFFRVLGGGTC